MSIDKASNETYISVNDILEKKGEVNREVNNEMGKHEFLMLMTKQMQYQDPMSPMDNSQMMAQLAQFTSLEQMTNLNHSFDFIKGMSMIGKMITSHNPENNTETIGYASSVSNKEGSTIVNVETPSGIVNVPIDQVKLVEEAQVETVQDNSAFF